MSHKPRKKKVNATGRNEGDGQFVPVPYSTSRSAAFRSLSGQAVKVWVELRSRYNGYNNGQLSLSFQEAAELLQMSKSTVGRAFKELETKGFIKLRKPGQWYGRLAAEWIVTDQKFNGNLATRDWTKWQPPAPVEKQKSVPGRHRRVSCVPDEYRETKFAVHTGTRQGHLKVIDGAK